MTVAAALTHPCPRCQDDLVVAAPAPAWCAGCEWGLDAFDPHRAPRVWGLRAGDRADHWLAYRLNRRQYASLAGRPLRHRGNPAARVALLLLALPMLLLGPLAVALGVLLIGGGSSLGVLLGLVLILCTVALSWPRRRTRHQQEWTVEAATAPALFTLLHRVAAAAGAPMPHEVRLDHTVNAYTSINGIRRRRVLCVGLPMWAALAPQERIALLAHEFGHFVNHDVRRGLTVGAGLRVLQNLLDMVRVAAWQGSLLALPLTAVAMPVLWLLSAAMLVLAGRDSQRAEYLADRIATRVAGSAATAGVFDALLVAADLPAAMAAGYRNLADPRDWHAAATHLRNPAGLPTRRLLSLRTEASLLQSHPPTGLRARMARTGPAETAQVTPTGQDWAAIDAELAPWYAKVKARLVS